MFDSLLRAFGKAALQAVEEAVDDAFRGGEGEYAGRATADRAAGIKARQSTNPTLHPEGRPTQPPIYPQKAATIREDVTAVLRRQVPPRNEAPRSWIGGLPMLPDDIEWPRAFNSEYPDKGEIPLNFLAQIACADLPTDLWGGLGPRKGWLLFFGASWGGVSFEDPNSFRAYHIAELGSERQPPPDKLSVGDPMYSGGDNPALVYECWPVDIVAIRNSPDFPSSAAWTGDDPVSPIPPNFADVLYGGAPIGTSFWHPTEKPFSWGAVAVMLERTLEDRARRPARRIEVARLAADSRDQAFAAIGNEEAILAKSLEDLDPERQAKRAVYIEKERADFAERRGFMARAGDPFDPEELARMIETSQADREAWLAQQTDVMTALLAEAAAHEPTTMISADDLADLDTIFSAEHAAWHMDTVSYRDRVPCPQRTTVTLSDLVSRERPRAVAAAARRLYRAGEDERALLPDDMRAALEADLRRLEYNRPHRLGGIHQPAQETLAPDGQMLLLQLGNDDPTGFMWGDSGALFAWIEIDALRRCDFNHVTWWTENT